MSQTILTAKGPIVLPQDIWDTASTLMEDMAMAPLEDVPAETVFDLFTTIIATALWAERMGLQETRQ